MPKKRTFCNRILFEWSPPVLLGGGSENLSHHTGKKKQVRHLQAEQRDGSHPLINAHGNKQQQQLQHNNSSGSSSGNKNEHNNDQNNRNSNVRCIYIHQACLFRGKDGFKGGLPTVVLLIPTAGEVGRPVDTLWWPDLVKLILACEIEKRNTATK